MAGQLTTKWRLDYYNRWKDQAAANAMLLNQAYKLPTAMETLAKDVQIAGSIASMASGVPPIGGGGGGGGGVQLPTDVGTGAGGNMDFGGAGFGDAGQTSGWM